MAERQAVARPAAPAPAKTKPKIWSDLSDALDSVKRERNWFAEGALEGNPVVIFTAAEKAGKSWALMDLAVATVTGGQWLGKFAVKRPGPVVYVDAELGAHEFARRAARIARGRGLDPRVVVQGLRHVGEHNAHGLLDRDAYQDHGDAGDRLARLMRDEEPSLVIVDPYRNLLPGHENDSRDTKRAGQVLRGLREYLGAPIVVAHHLNKAGGPAGSRALRGLGDLMIEGTDETPSWYSSTGRTLRRDDAIGRRFTIAIEHEHDQDDERARTRLKCRFDGEKGAGAALSKSALQVLDALRAAADTVTVGWLQRQLNRNSPVIKGALVELEAAGLAVRKGNVWEATTAEFFDALAEDARLKMVNGQTERVTT